MKRINTKAITAFIFMMVVAASSHLFAQTAQNVGATVPAQNTKTIGFRSVAWQHKHIHDMAAAAKLIESLEKIGCEVIQEDHNGHLDVRFRCANWKSITVENDDFAKQWTAWLAGNGLETVVVEPPATPGLEIVKFRKAEWQQVHLHDAQQVDQMITMLKLIGCEANKQEHDGHFDVRYRSGAEWKTIALHSHDAAHSWQDWLKSLGFETEHSH